MTFSHKIFGNKHSILSRLIPLVEGLDEEFGEENVYIGPFCNVRSNGQGTHVHLKYFDPRWQTFRLQARKGDGLQYFFLKLGEDHKPDIEEFLRKNGYL
jgi:hypothetical protein